MKELARPKKARMEEVARQLRKQVRLWGKRPLTEKDFYAICRRRGVFVTENSGPHMKWRGIYTVLGGIPTIILKPSGPGLDGLLTKFHELGHHFLHAPEICYADDQTISEAQYEANAFAAVCVFPQMNESLAEMFRLRVELFKRYGL